MFIFSILIKKARFANAGILYGRRVLGGMHPFLRGVFRTCTQEELYGHSDIHPKSLSDFQADLTAKHTVPPEFLINQHRFQNVTGQNKAVVPSLIFQFFLHTIYTKIFK